MLVHILQSVLYTVYLPSAYEMEPILAGLATPKPSHMPTFDYNLRLIFAITNMWWLGLWLVKLAMLAFYWRLFDSVRTHARLFWWFMFGVTISTFVISVLLNAFACQPLGSFYHFGKCRVVKVYSWRKVIISVQVPVVGQTTLHALFAAFAFPVYQTLSPTSSVR